MKYLLKFEVSNTELTQELVSLFNRQMLLLQSHVNFSKEEEQVLSTWTQILKENDLFGTCFSHKKTFKYVWNNLDM